MEATEQSHQLKVMGAERPSGRDMERDRLVMVEGVHCAISNTTISLIVVDFLVVMSVSVII
jgi:hypothetical protein